MSNRNKKKITLEMQMLGLMEKDEELCGDNTHAAAAILFEEKFGASLNVEHIKFINSLDRARRKVFKDFPHLDLRTKTKTVLEPADKQYYAQG